MAVKTDMAALRSEAANIIGLLTAAGHETFSLDKTADFFDDVLRLLEAERQKVKELSASEWNLAGELVALQGNRKPVAYAVRNHFWKGGRANFQGKYHDLHFAENLKSAWDVEIPLFTTQPAPSVVLTQLMVDTIIPAIDADGLDEELHHCEYTLYRDRERIRRQLQEAGCIAKDGE